MMNISVTDIIIAATSLWFLHQGWQKGFLRTIIGPISLIVGSILPFFYFQKTHNMLHSLILGIIAPFAVYLVLSMFSKFLQKATKWDETKIARPSRILGSIANFFWKESFVILIIITIGLIPFELPGLDKAYRDIHRSVVYQIFSGWKDKQLSSNDSNKVKNIASILKTMEDPKNLERLKASKEVLEILSDPKFNELSSSILPKLSTSNNWQDIANDPKIQSILSDPEFKKKMDRLMEKSGHITQEQINH